MVEQCFILKLEDGRLRLEVINVITSIHKHLFIFTAISKIASAASSGITSSF